MTTLDLNIDTSGISQGDEHSSTVYETQKPSFLSFNLPTLKSSKSIPNVINEHFKKEEEQVSRVYDAQKSFKQRTLSVFISPTKTTLSDSLKENHLNESESNYRFISPSLRCLTDGNGLSEFVNPSDLPKIEKSRGIPFTRQERALIRDERNNFREESLSKIQKDKQLNGYYRAYQKTLHTRILAASVIASRRVEIAKSITTTRATKAIKSITTASSVGGYVINTTGDLAKVTTGSKKMSAIVEGVEKTADTAMKIIGTSGVTALKVGATAVDEGIKLLPIAGVAAEMADTYAKELELTDSEKLLHFIGDLDPLEVSKDLGILTTFTQTKSIKQAGSKPSKLGNNHAEKTIDFIHENYNKGMPSKDLLFVIDRVSF